MASRRSRTSSRKRARKASSSSRPTASPAATSSARHRASPAATSSARRRPTPEAVRGARNKGLQDVIAPGLKVLFCGINPGLYSAATGNHYARPGNRFWPALHAAGFTPRLLHPSEKELLLEAGYGLTNLVDRATAGADELAPEEFVAGQKRLAAKVRRYRPATVAFLGVGAYRHAFGRPKAGIGPQAEPFEGARVWVLPSPSGLNANYLMPELVQLLRQLWQQSSTNPCGGKS